jgi:ubiquinone/menaquinone biosynthesis C-methylase UbiE
MNQIRNHYSYKIYADPQIARSFDSDRFGGSIGEFIKWNQEQIVFRELPSVEGWKIADVGAGTGRLTIPLIEKGAKVTACDASAQMLEVLQQKTDSPNLEIKVVDAQELPFPDRHFDCTLSFRMLLHVVDWKKALSELCRVSNDWVIIDFPPKHGFLLLAPVWHSVRKLFSSNVQSYRTFETDEIFSELKLHGFDVVSIDPGFFLPLVVYRTFRSKRLMNSAEKLFSRISLTRRFGSPFTLIARRSR